MSILEQYELWDNKQKNEILHQDTIDFFETHPTKQQLMIMDRTDKRRSQGMSLMLLLGFLMGAVLGCMIGYSIGSTVI